MDREAHDRQSLRLELVRLAGAKLPFDAPAEEMIRFAKALEAYVTAPLGATVPSERNIGFITRAA
jgi:hypothetical protein